jgi:1-acyl-sn-glycerol-3-phosphate acyltransferase
MYYFLYNLLLGALNVIFKIKYHIHLHGTLPNDFDKGGYIVASNHQNNLDPVVIAALTTAQNYGVQDSTSAAKDNAAGGFFSVKKKFPLFPLIRKTKFSFMAKTELFNKNPVFSALIKFCGAFPVNRGVHDSAAIDRAISDLKNGKVFVIFAEGHRSKTGAIAECKTGFSLIAEKSGCKVLPACIVYGIGGDKKRIDFSVGEAITVESNDDKKAKAAFLTEKLRELQKEIYEKANLTEEQQQTAG